MNEILTATTIIVPVILGATGALKTRLSDNKWLPFINVIVGIVIGILYAATIVEGDLAVYAWAGGLAGLSAGGFYDLGANTKAIVNQNKSTNLISEGKGLQDNQEEE